MGESTESDKRRNQIDRFVCNNLAIKDVLQVNQQEFQIGG